MAKELISKIRYHVEETRERTNLDQCTEDAQDEVDHGQKGAIAETSDAPFVQVAGKSDDTSSASSTLRKRRKRGTYAGPCKLGSPQTDETLSAVKQDTHTCTGARLSRIRCSGASSS